MKITIEQSFELSEDAVQLLKDISKAGFAEYRDNEYDDINEWRLDFPDRDKRPDSWFLARNFGGSHKIAQELFELSLIEDVKGSWHSTYRISQLGKLVLSNV